LFKEAFTVGQRVRFARSHDKVTKLFGKIVKIHDGAVDCVDIETEPDGKAVEVASLETAHAGDVVLAPQKVSQPVTPAPDATEEDAPEDPGVTPAPDATEDAPEDPGARG